MNQEGLLGEVEGEVRNEHAPLTCPASGGPASASALSSAARRQQGARRCKERAPGHTPVRSPSFPLSSRKNGELPAAAAAAAAAASIAGSAAPAESF